MSLDMKPHWSLWEPLHKLPVFPSHRILGDGSDLQVLQIRFQKKTCQTSS